MGRDAKGTKRNAEVQTQGSMFRRLNPLNVPTQLTNTEGFQIANKHVKRCLTFLIREM